MSALANPETSQVLLIDPVSHRVDEFDADLAAQLLRRFECLSAAADQALAPRTFAISQKVNEPDIWLSKPCEKRKVRIFDYERDRSVWISPGLFDSINKENREQLFICGFWMDDAVAAAAIEAQTYGFDTHIISDLSPAYSRDSWQPFVDRFSQYGVLPIPLNTLLYEWMTKTEDHGRRQSLEKLWQSERGSAQIGHLRS